MTIKYEDIVRANVSVEAQSHHSSIDDILEMLDIDADDLKRFAWDAAQAPVDWAGDDLEENRQMLKVGYARGFAAGVVAGREYRDSPEAWDQLAQVNDDPEDYLFLSFTSRDIMTILKALQLGAPPTNPAVQQVGEKVLKAIDTQKGKGE